MITVTRSNLAWVLGATIPHVGKPAQFASVGLAVQDETLLAYATDGYTAAIARAAAIPAGEPFDLRITARPSLQASSDAVDLLRYVRPNTVGERDQEVALLQQDNELHVGLGDDSQVFETAERGPTLHAVRELIRAEHILSSSLTDCLYSPAILSRFTSAQRSANDRLALFPKRKDGNLTGKMLVTVGADFIGAVAGMMADPAINPGDVIDSFLLTPLLVQPDEAA